MARNSKQKARPVGAGAATRQDRRVLKKNEEESMEAKVDVRKLQILNDRINQTIDALSQVRLSVHGLGHTGVPTPMMNPFGTIPTLGYPSVPTYPIPPLGMIPPISPFTGPLGLSHTPVSPFVNPFINFPTPYTTPVVNPMIPPIPTTGLTPNWVPTPWTGFGGGLLHSAYDPLELKLLEARALDPLRIRETFPFVTY
ncbi:MAG: hypothetical protein ACM3JJ_12750 [Hyphomicrobiales bacterium]